MMNNELERIRKETIVASEKSGGNPQRPQIYWCPCRNANLAPQNTNRRKLPLEPARSIWRFYRHGSDRSESLIMYGFCLSIFQDWLRNPEIKHIFRIMACRGRAPNNPAGVITSEESIMNYHTCENYRSNNDFCFSLSAIFFLLSFHSVPFFVYIYSFIGPEDDMFINC
jgi:hypothetical protein